MANLISQPNRAGLGANIANGFDDRSKSTISFDDGTRTFTIAVKPPFTKFTFWSDDREFEVLAGSPDTIVIPDVSGPCFIYYNEHGNLTDFPVTDAVVAAKFLVPRYAIISRVVWNATTGVSAFFSDIRHGREMSGFANLHIQLTQGAALVRGGAITNLSTEASGNDASSAQLGVEATDFMDADILHEISDGVPQDINVPAQIPVFYRKGAGDGEVIAAAPNDFPIMYGGRVADAPGLRACYNTNSGPSAPLWELIEAGNNKFVLIHLFTSSEVSKPMMVITGENQYDTIIAARAGALVELDNMMIQILAFSELLPLGTVIIQTANSYSNTPKSRFREIETGVDYIDHRERPSTAAGGGGGGGATTFDGLTDTPASKVGQALNAVRVNVGGTALEYVDLNTLYFQETEHLNASAGVADAGKPIVLDAAGHIDETMVNDADISHLNIGDIGANSHAQVDAHLANASNPHGVTAAQAGADTAGSAAAVQTNLTTHENDGANPHTTTFTQAVAADGGTDITAAEAETLTNGSNADPLHTHLCMGDVTDNELAHIFAARLSPTPSVAVPTGNFTSVGALYLHRFGGNSIAIYDTSTNLWCLHQMTGTVSKTITGLIVARNYDVYVFDSAGTLTLEYVAWTSDVARATALVLQDGVYCKTGDLSRRYVGTFRTTASNSTTWIVDGGTTVSAKLFIWNYYNRKPVRTITKEDTNGWVYVTAAWRYMNNSSDNRVEVVIGIQEDYVEVRSQCSLLSSTQAQAAAIGIGYGSSTVDSSELRAEGSMAVGGRLSIHASLMNQPAAGYRWYAAIEYSRLGTPTYEGDLGIPTIQSGVTGHFYA